MDPFNLEIILKSGYWPGSPVSRNYLFSEKLVVFRDSIRKRMPGSSETTFLMAPRNICFKNGCVRKFVA